MNVTVVNNQPQVSNDNYQVSKGNRNVTIQWVLTTPGWNWTSGGTGPIVFSGNAQNQFGSPQVNGTTLSVTDANSVGGSYPYTLYVTNSRTGEIRRVDPQITNQP